MNKDTRTVPKRLQVLQALQEHLAQISAADGYNFTLAERVFRNRLLFGPDVKRDPNPALSVIEAPRADIALYAAENQTWSRNYLTLLIQGVVKDDKTANTEDDAYFLCNDVERSLIRLVDQSGGNGRPKYADEYLLGGIIAGIEVAPAVVRPAEPGVSATAFFYLAVRIELAGKIGE